MRKEKVKVLLVCGRVSVVGKEREQYYRN